MLRLRYFLKIFSVITFSALIFQSCKEKESSNESDPPKSPLKTVEANFPQEKMFAELIKEIDSSK
ncbi:MAG: hypothetical protein ACKN86_05805, partial [Crocinitomicaceae bacterium]